MDVFKKLTSVASVTTEQVDQMLLEISFLPSAQAGAQGTEVESNLTAVDSPAQIKLNTVNTCKY